MSFKKFCNENQINLRQNEDMSKHTSFKIGGNADYFVTVCSVDELKSVVEKCKELKMPYFILGKGSNFLVSD